ncbi:putative membrane protein [Wickerhamomyces ciferrii]|uniref:Membrane protein n=1 Tax=Wickerhamomyces ciferrii (strain ATCC 14091 / BCRC 22168 / CBS 111 / JCM 3599 / NBRC 0793 / NRRL Y-1031 F-60-10) TaxID=1206466 RepID=K0KTX8_WICCF|nr:uncharacterized protein BN7_4413 [Wickerhamomyces ciferrii]CCH44844.1 putative membrane protein [Wickerhamomyces ciferrii]
MLEHVNCSIYENPLKSTFIVSVIISIGIVLSYVPQHIKIVQTKSSTGLSPVFLLLSSLSGIAATSNLILLSFISIPCCLEITKFECINSQISLIQVGLQTFSTLLVVFLCVIFTRNPLDYEEYLEVIKVWKQILWFTGFIIISLIISFIYGIKSSNFILKYAQILGIFSTIVAIIQYLPQLKTTIHLKKAGSLSIPMMCIQTPGGFIWTATLILKPGSNWSSWFPYLTGAVLQGTLLVLCTYYEYIAEKDEVLLVQEDQYYTFEE